MCAAAIAAALCTALPAAAGAAVIVPNTETDALAPDDGRCTLREAITAANANAASGPAAGECPAGAGADEIVLPHGFYRITIFNSFGAQDENANATGDLDITSDVTLRGAGAGSTTVAGRFVDRLFDVAGGVTATMEGITVTGGYGDGGEYGDNVTGTNGTGAGPGTSGVGTTAAPGADGGGIRNLGTLTLRNMVISGNEAGDGGYGGSGTGGNGGPTAGDAGAGTGGAAGAGGRGGGVFSSGNLTIEDSVIAHNLSGNGGYGGSGRGGTAGAGGGDGADGVGGPAAAGGGGGGVASTGTAAILRTTITANETGSGGYGGDGTGTAGANGSAGVAGGLGGAGVGMPAGGGGEGGGVFSGGGMTIADSTISHNHTGNGGYGGSGNGGKGGNGGNNANGAKGGNGTGSFAGPGGSGGGIAARGAVTATNVTVHGNSTDSGGYGGSADGGNGGNGAGTGNGGNGGSAAGGGAAPGGSGGGAVSVTAGALDLTHATISANTPLGGGGNGGGGGTSLAGTGVVPGTAGAGVAGSAAGAGSGSALFRKTAATLRNSISSGDCAGVPITDAGNNVSFPDASCPGAVADPKLGPLDDNGGPTRTQKLALDSGALDRVPAAGAGCVAADQRGGARPQGPGCDSGAFEAGGLADLALAKTRAASKVGLYKNIGFTVTVRNDGPDRALAVAVTDTPLKTLLGLSATPSLGTCALGAAITCTAPALEPGATLTIPFSLQAIGIGAATNTATATSSATDVDPADNAASATASITVKKGACANTRTGTKGKDKFQGTTAGDRLNGGAGNDTLSGGAGNDCLAGGKGKDGLDGGANDDNINSRDGVREKVKCGSGRDRVTADRIDQLSGCERVSRG